MKENEVHEQQTKTCTFSEEQDMLTGHKAEGKQI